MQYEWILIDLFAQVKAGVIDDIVLLHDIRLFEIATACGVLAGDFELGVEIWVRGGCETLKETCLGEEKRTSTDGEEGALLAGVLLLEGSVGLEEGDGFGEGVGLCCCSGG